MNSWQPSAALQGQCSISLPWIDFILSSKTIRYNHTVKNINSSEVRSSHSSLFLNTNQLPTLIALSPVSRSWVHLSSSFLGHWLSFLARISSNGFKQFSFVGSRECAQGGRRSSSSAFSGEVWWCLPYANSLHLTTATISCRLESTNPSDTTSVEPLHCPMLFWLHQPLASAVLGTTSTREFQWNRPRGDLWHLRSHFAKQFRRFAKFRVPASRWRKLALRASRLHFNGGVHQRLRFTQAFQASYKITILSPWGLSSVHRGRLLK